MIKILKLIPILFLLLFVGCKAAKSISTSGNLDAALTSKQLIKQHEKQQTKFKTLQAKVKVEYIQGEHSQTHTITLRMERNKTIWISSAFSIVRAIITPEKVGFYNKLDNTYFDGDYTLINELLGADLNFENLQNLILGEAIFKMNDKSYVSDMHESSYVLSPKNQNVLLEIFFLMNPSHFKMDSQQLTQPVQRRMLQIDYENYQEVQKQILPQNINIFALNSGEETKIIMEFKAISLNHELRFPFRIPSGFDLIVIR